MAHHDHIKRDVWFAWYPVKTTDDGWVWFKTVNREIDARPLVYNGLYEEFRYWVNTAPECFHCLDMQGKCFICNEQIYQHSTYENAKKGETPVSGRSSKNGTPS